MAATLLEENFLMFSVMEGLETYFENFAVSTFSSSPGFMPCAFMEPSSGISMLPSGCTVTSFENSWAGKTLIFITSPASMKYSLSSPGPSRLKTGSVLKKSTAESAIDMVFIG